MESKVKVIRNVAKGFRMDGHAQTLLTLRYVLGGNGFAANAYVNSISHFEEYKGLFLSPMGNEYWFASKEDGPALIFYNTENSIHGTKIHAMIDGYMHNGDLHREDGPAVIEYRGSNAV